MQREFEPRGVHEVRARRFQACVSSGSRQSATGLGRNRTIGFSPKEMCVVQLGNVVLVRSGWMVVGAVGRRRVCGQGDRRPSSESAGHGWAFEAQKGRLQGWNQGFWSSCDVNHNDVKLMFLCLGNERTAVLNVCREGRVVHAKISLGDKSNGLRGLDHIDLDESTECVLDCHRPYPPAAS